jgi:hypothetical protein
MMSWVSLSFGVVDFSMMPSVGDGSVGCTTTTPPVASRQRGSEGLFTLRLWPRLNLPGNDSNAPFASERQSFLRRRSKILRALRMTPHSGSSADSGPTKPAVSLASS